MENVSGYFALAGIVAGFVPLIIIEKYKRHLERCAVAQAFIGEISAILDMIERRKFVNAMMLARDAAAQGKVNETSVFDFGLQRDDKDPVFENYIKKFGLLRLDLPKGIVKFYAQLQGIRIDIIRLAEGSAFKTSENQHKILNEDLDIWTDTERLGKDLIDRLGREANKIFLSKYIMPLVISVIFSAYLLWYAWISYGYFLSYLGPL